MPDQNDIDRVWDIIENNSIGMLTTQFGGGLRARPWTRAPTAMPARSSSSPTFAAQGRRDRGQAGCLLVVSCEATTSISRSPAARRSPAIPARPGEIWKKTDDVWWKGGPDDPNARVLTIEPVTAELWDGPSSSLVAAYEFAKARITGEKPFLGENRKKTVPMG